jgi:hypothetical protein
MKFIAELRDVQLKSRLVFTGKMNRQYVVGHKLLSVHFAPHPRRPISSATLESRRRALVDDPFGLVQRVSQLGVDLRFGALAGVGCQYLNLPASRPLLSDEFEALVFHFNRARHAAWLRQAARCPRRCSTGPDRSPRSLLALPGASAGWKVPEKTDGCVTAPRGTVMRPVNTSGADSPTVSTTP